MNGLDLSELFMLLQDQNLSQMLEMLQNACLFLLQTHSTVD